MAGDVDPKALKRNTAQPTGGGRLGQHWWMVAVVAFLLGAGLSTSLQSSTSSGLQEELAASDAKVTLLTQERDSLLTQLAESKAEPSASQPGPAESATVAEPDSADARSTQQAAFRSVFADGRADLLAALEDDDNIETVDKLAFDSKKKLVVLDVTSAWASPDNRADGAWAITRAMAELWKPDSGAWWQEDFVPAFRLVNSGKAYQCSGEFMARLGDASASRSDWNRETR